MGEQTGQPLVVNPIVIDLKHAFDLQRTVTSHGWARLAPFRWSSDTETLSHADAIDGRIVTWTVRQSGPLRLSIDVDVPSDDALVEEVETRVHRSLMLAWNPSEAVATAQRIDPDVAQDVETGGGRLLRGTTFFEDVYKTICTINTSWANTVRLTDAISTNFGRGSAPTPADIVDSGIANLGSVLAAFRRAGECSATREDDIEGPSRCRRGVPGEEYAGSVCRMDLGYDEFSCGRGGRPRSKASLE